jgi:hypothetical protein
MKGLLQDVRGPLRVRLPPPPNDLTRRADGGREDVRSLTRSRAPEEGRPEIVGHRHCCQVLVEPLHLVARPAGAPAACTSASRRRPCSRPRGKHQHCLPGGGTGGAPCGEDATSLCLLQAVQGRRGRAATTSTPSTGPWKNPLMGHWSAAGLGSYTRCRGLLVTIDGGTCGHHPRCRGRSYARRQGHPRRC